METKQTAVEYLLQNMYLITGLKWDQVIEQAKQMESEQIKDAYNYGYLDYSINMHENAEQYYNETYG